MVYHILMYYITTFLCQMSSSSLCDNHIYNRAADRAAVTAHVRHGTRRAYRFRKISRDRSLPARNPLLVLIDKLHNTVVVVLCYLSLMQPSRRRTSCQKLSAPAASPSCHRLDWAVVTRCALRRRGRQSLRSFRVLARQ